MKEIVVLSGKGGAGKTTVCAAFAQLAKDPVLVDCDVDAANLHLLLNPAVEEQNAFTGGAKARINPALCTGCGACAAVCRFGAIQLNGSASVLPWFCEGCGVCARRCAARAITLEATVAGWWYLSRTVAGPLVHARLDPGGENSGKLVSILREAARKLARERDARWILADGPPGAGCPVISSLTGADYAVFVTEPTPAGIADFDRAAAVADHFRIPTGVIVNKWDLNPTLTGVLEQRASTGGRDILGKIPYDTAWSKAQCAHAPVLDSVSPDLRRCLESIWEATQQAVQRRIAPIRVVP